MKELIPETTQTRRFPVLSTDPELNDRIVRICSRLSNVFEPVVFDNEEDYLEFIRYELPEFQFVHFSDGAVKPFEVLDKILDDPWLHYGGIVGVYSKKDSRRVRNLPPETNVFSLIPRTEFVETFFRVLLILVQNRQILFQRDIQLDLLGTLNGSFELDNDPYNARTYANLIANYLFNARLIDLEGRDRLHVAIFEMLMNAIEHGNCGISYEEKTRYIEEHGDILPLIRLKRRDPDVAGRKVFFNYRIAADQSSFTIRDEGGGFDWRSRLAEDGVNLDMHGHGIRMTRHYIDNIRYNETGNEVSFDFRHKKQSNIRPGLFENQEEEVYRDGETVFEEGDTSNDLYFIVAGSFDVFSNGHPVASLQPDDLFLGEMSFLLGNRRSATVCSVGESRLLRISKEAFVEGIQRQPHYGIFLARLLAQRLTRLNQQFVLQRG